MFTNLCLLAWAVVGAPGAYATDLQSSLRLEAGHEAVYTGDFREEWTVNGVEYRRAFRLETRLLVLKADPGALEVAFLTVVKTKGNGSDKGDATEPSSARLETARIDMQGHLSSSNEAAFRLPLDGPATLECAAFVEISEGRIAPGQAWRLADGQRPEKIWRFLGSEDMNGASCLKVECVQQTEDWEQPRADRAAWRRKETIWLSRHWGIATRIERVIERREAAHREPTQRSVTIYDQPGPIQYRTQLFADRIHEITQAQSFEKMARGLTLHPTIQRPKDFDALLTRIARHVESTPRTPYRDAVLGVRARLEAARRGESPPTRPETDDLDASAAAAAGGNVAPDFVASNLFTKASVRLHNYAGRPVLLVFYTPATSSAETALRFAQRLQREHQQNITVLGLALSDDVAELHRQYEELRLTFPIVAGRMAGQSYRVEGTPHLVVIGADSSIRGAYTGWGPETAVTVEAELRRCLQPSNPPQSASPARASSSSAGRLRP